MKTLVLVLSLTGISTLLSITAFGYSGETTIAMLKQEERANGIIEINGSLSCNMGSENTGKGCTLKIKESETGKIYTLNNSDTAMRLFQNGSKNVSIKGKLSDAETINIRSVQAL